MCSSDLEHLWLAESRSALDKSRGRSAEHHLTRRSHRLHSLSQPHLLADGGVTQSTRTDLTGDHLTGIETNAQL